MPTREPEGPDPSDFTPTWRFSPQLPNNEPFGAEEVFNFYPPDNPVPGMDLVSPEHMIIDSQGIDARMSSVSGDIRRYDVCDLDTFIDAAYESPEALISLISERYLRGRQDFDHRQVLMEMAENVPGTMSVMRDPNSEYYSPHTTYAIGVFFGFSLLGEEYGVVR